MELYFKIARAKRQDWLRRIVGKSDFFSGLLDISKDREEVQSVILSMREKGTLFYKEIDTQILAQVFSAIVYRLAGGRSINLLFPRDTELGSVKREIKKINLQWAKVRKWLTIDVTSMELCLFSKILEAISFAHFYAEIDGKEDLPDKALDIFQKMEKRYVVIVFSLYDESIEIISELVTAEAVLKISRELGEEMGFEVILQNREEDDGSGLHI